MSRLRVLFTLLTALLCAAAADAAGTASPWYTFFDRAQILEVDAPNLLKVKMLGSNKVMQLRLLGVGSPRNRDRIKGLSPGVLWHIQHREIWQASRQYVQAMLKDKSVEVWTRTWNRYDTKHRLLAYLIIPSDSQNSLDLNAEIIKKGLGFVTRDYVHVTFVRYKDLEEEARKNRRGLWQGLSLERVSSLNQ